MKTRVELESRVYDVEYNKGADYLEDRVKATRNKSGLNINYNFVIKYRPTLEAIEDVLLKTRKEEGVDNG